MDERSPVDVIYLDFQKAFDKVPHQRLILKLKLHGMGNSIIHWIEQWLNDRRQRVVVDREVSSWKPVFSGVRQGAVLGPILFLVYINDLEEGVTGKILKFADDTKLFRKVKEIGDKQKLQDDIDKLVKWSENWQMLFNFGICKCLHTGSGNTGVKYETGGTILSCVQTDLCRITMSGKVSDLPIRSKRALFRQKKLDRINFKSGKRGRVLLNPPGVTTGQWVSRVVGNVHGHTILCHMVLTRDPVMTIG